MKHAGNWHCITNENGSIREQDSFTCGHCSKIVLVGPKQKGEDIGGMCKICYNLICGPCADLGICEPFEKKLEKQEARDRFRRQAGL